MRTVDVGPTFEAWQAVARVLLHEAVPPAEVTWHEAPPGAVAPTPGPAPASARVPRQFLDLARQAAAAADPARWALLYEILWRLVHDRRDLLADTRDPMVRRLNALAAQARRQSPPAERRPLEPAGRRRVRSRRARRSTSCARPRARCQGCDLFRHATQTVFGRGPADARIVLVGEQPGDQEDLQGRAVRRPGRRGARSCAGRGRPGPPARLRHQRREALQVHRARQATHPRDTPGAGDHRVPAVARGRAGGHPAGGARCPRRHRGPRDPRPGVSPAPPARPVLFRRAGRPRPSPRCIPRRSCVARTTRSRPVSTRCFATTSG